MGNIQQTLFSTYREGHCLKIYNYVNENIEPYYIKTTMAIWSWIGTLCWIFKLPFDLF